MKLCKAKHSVTDEICDAGHPGPMREGSALRAVLAYVLQTPLLLMGIAVLTAIHIGGQFWLWLVELASSLPFQYALAAFGLGLLCLIRRQYLFCAVALALAFANLQALGARSAEEGGPAGEETIEVYAANLFRTNGSLKRLIRDVREEQPDVVFFCEVVPDHVQALASLKDLFPHRVEHALEGYEGFLFLSRWPISDSWIIMEEAHGNRPMLASQLSVRGKTISVYGMHPHAPTRPKRFRKRNQQLEWLCERVAASTEPVVVVGDLNVTPYSPVFRNLLARSGLTAARKGQGWYPSWPAFLPILWVPIDHVLVSPHLRVNGFRRGPFIGSDHYPIVANLSFKEV